MERRPRPALVLAFVGVAALLAALLLAAALPPASLARTLVERASEGRWTIADSRGTLWRGQGRLAETAGQASLPLAWRVESASLLGGTPSVLLGHGDLADRDLADRSLALRGRVRLLHDGIELRDLDASCLASLVMAFAPRGVPLAVGGHLRATTPFLVLGTAPAGAGRVAWTGARLADARGQVLDLGDVDAVATTRGDATVVTLSNRGGDVVLGGEIALAAARATGTVTLAARGAPPPLMQALAAFGQPDGSGGYRFAVGAARAPAR